ncbi:MAG: SAM-dependent chlorinase/fluorinase [Acidobacteria bacterium]|nr:SAM-dependent chlorinase/fluorinase [Acidobacteriota bacterium]
MPRSIVTLTSDFGLTDAYAGVMKGVILSINPEVDVVDITHDVRPYDLLEGALAISQTYRYFPPRTIHMVIVDPGVGSARRPLLVSAANQYFIAPDNGVLSLVYAREEDVTVRHITAAHYFLEPVSHTFHGRDIFAPTAGWLSRHVETEKFGDIVTDHVRFTFPQPKKVNERLLKGVVLRVDRFGNLMTNVTPADVPQLFGENPPAFKVIVGKTEITRMFTAYSQGAPGEVFAILGSSGYLEIVSYRASAAQTLTVGKGAEVGVVFA